MKIVRMFMGREIRWNIKHSDLSSVPIRSLDGMRVISPLVPIVGRRHPYVIPIASDTWHVITDSLSFTVPDGSETDGISERLAPFIRTIRAESRQASLSDSVLATSSYSASRLPKRGQPEVFGGRVVLLGSYRIKTALTFDLIRRVANQSVLATTAVYDETMLDAINAHERDDYRQAILYAAIAVESVASSVLQAKYVDILLRKHPPKHVNICSIEIAGGKISRKDPIYGLLTKGDNFARLLHEVPLYLLRRTMRDKDEALYQSCVRLYSARNRLGHGKPYDATHFPLDRKGSLNALKVAVAAFEWFGKSGFYVPVLDQVKLTTADG